MLLHHARGTFQPSFMASALARGQPKLRQLCAPQKARGHLRAFEPRRDWNRIPWLWSGFWRWCSSVLASVCCWQAFHEEYSRLYLLAKETPTPQNDTRLQHVLIYLLQNNAPQQVVERTLLEQFADKNLSYDERCVPQVWDEAVLTQRQQGPW